MVAPKFLVLDIFFQKDSNSWCIVKRVSSLHLQHTQKHIQSVANCLSPWWGALFFTHCISFTDTWISVPFNYQLLIGPYCQSALLSRLFPFGYTVTVAAWFLLDSFCIIGLLISIEVWCYTVTTKLLKYQTLSSCILSPVAHWNKIKLRW
jgi:hypothetical protein